MATYVLEHPASDPASTVSFELDVIIVELLCFDRRWNAIVRAEDNAAVIGGLKDVFECALQRWGHMPKVINGLVMFAVQPGAKELLLPALGWTSAAIKSFDS
jgi:hypothetical protein